MAPVSRNAMLKVANLEGGRLEQLGLSESGADLGVQHAQEIVHGVCWESKSRASCACSQFKVSLSFLALERGSHAMVNCRAPRGSK